MAKPKDRPRTLFDKIWERHTIVERDDGQTLLYIDRQYIGDDLPPDIFEALDRRGIAVRRPDLNFATPDHYVPTTGRSIAAIADPERRAMVEAITRNARARGITLFGIGDPRQGIVHVVGPEQGLSQPGMTIVCGDSHTSTHGALGALAFGIGSSEVSHVLATQSLWQIKPKSMRICIGGKLGAGVTAKDVVMAIIAKLGVAGAAGFAVEYAGEAIRGLSIEGRMTVCNMSIEAGARAGMVAPDETTFAYLQGRPYAPKGGAWAKALDDWRGLASDPDAEFDQRIALDAADVAPMVTWGTNPGEACAITDRIPDPAAAADAESRTRAAKSLAYMGLAPGTPLTEVAVDRIFIGSCTNSRIEDLRVAAKVVEGRRCVVPAIVVPGSGLVKRQAEAEGLDRIFKDAGLEWREPGCSMCIAVNGDFVEPGQRCASTSNRNFVGRQGRGARTHLMSPAMAAAAAVTGRLTDVRRLLAEA
ncbi:MAG TPA: 3-isopropylmalate dehydratase large subunit [Alphaproteobacteria bacterium]|nr:3-isopropylmalate dehydratase large subunit [Alphaproteobacteria bacterium]